MQEQEEIAVDEIEWDDRNLTHAARHGVTPTVVREVLDQRPLFRRNLAGRSGDHRMIGPDRSGRFWTVILLDLGAGRWRPITGWPTDNEERGWYARVIARQD